MISNDYLSFRFDFIGIESNLPRGRRHVSDKLDLSRKLQHHVHNVSKAYVSTRVHTIDIGRK